MKRKWWQEIVVYQVYWRSFCDSNGDGFGDLRGVIEKLDYIKSLGIDVIWLNPFYESPDVDNGYDVSDYYSIMAKAGTMADFEELLHKVHLRGMKLIMDVVVNHTSDQHPWFIESRSSKDNPKRDWYIWRSGKEGHPPNDWRSYFTPSTWEYDARTGEYYFHSFATEQPDLNWENPEVRAEIYRMLRYWLDKGVDGFRLDVINLLAKQEGFPNAEKPSDISYLGNNPGIHEYLQEMHEQVLQHYDIFTVGEIPFVTPEDGLLYVGEDRKELHMLFHFEIADHMPTWDMLRFKEIQQRWYDHLWGKGWNSQFINNHDHTRVVTRYGNDQEYRIESAKLFATLIHTLPGIPYIYQGEEIGMTGIRHATIDDYHDIAMKNRYAEEVAKGREPQEVMQSLQLLSRDNSRTPMQWNPAQQAGFTTGTPWIKVNSNYKDINVEQSLLDPNSIYYYYQRLIQMRKELPVMIYGTYRDLMPEHEQIYAYVRELDGVHLLVILAITEKMVAFTLPCDLQDLELKLLLGNYVQEGEGSSLESIDLYPYEARIYVSQ